MWRLKDREILVRVPPPPLPSARRTVQRIQALRIAIEKRARAKWHPPAIAAPFRWALLTEDRWSSGIGGRNSKKIKK